MKLVPLGSKIVVLKTDPKGVTKGGIVLPDSAKERPKQGKVLAVGDGTRMDDGKLIALTVKVGDEVLFPPYAGTEIETDDNKLLILDESDVLVLVK